MPRLIPLLLFALTLPALAAGPATAPARAGRAAWMRSARHGVMSHYLADWLARRENLAMSPETWNDLVDHFDVDALAAQLHAAGADYYLFTIGQNSGYFCAPNPTYDRLTGISPSHCSRRDLVADLAGALARYDIRLLVYLPSGAPAQDRAAVQALDWHNGPDPNKAFQRNWEAVIRDWSTRWGTKISGWWFDGCYWPNAMYRADAAPNFASFAAAARAGNPDAVVAFNPGVVDRLLSVTPHEDYTAGEINDLDRLMIRRVTNGKVDGAHPHVLSFLGTTWGHGAPRFTAEQAVAHTRKATAAGASVTWDVPLTTTGTILPEFLAQLTALAKPPAEK